MSKQLIVNVSPFNSCVRACAFNGTEIDITNNMKMSARSIPQIMSKITVFPISIVGKISWLAINLKVTLYT